MQLLHTEWNINKFVISDVRFEYEADFIRSLGGKLFRIISPERTKYSTSNYTPEQKLHVSEIELDNYKDFNSIIYNDFNESISLNMQMLAIKLYLGE
jgi:hypothetical protein